MKTACAFLVFALVLSTLVPGANARSKYRGSGVYFYSAFGGYGGQYRRTYLQRLDAASRGGHTR